MVADSNSVRISPSAVPSADRLRGLEGVVDLALHFKAVFALNDPITLGSQGKAREAGKLRIEGKEYVVQDGDVIEFRFNV